MLRRNLWKIVLSLAIIVWAVTSLIPLKDQPLGEYASAHAGAKPAEFAKVISQADALVSTGQSPSIFSALKQIGDDQKIDLSQFFPDIRLESSMRNISKRNDILLNELAKRAKGRLQLGLDLKGGVAFMLEVDPKATASEQENVRQQKLTKAIEIIGNRINAFGVAEPLIRPVGDNRIEVQLPGVSTKNDPEVVDSLKKPARLDFRLVYPGNPPADAAPTDAPPGYELMTLDQEQRNGDIATEPLYVKRIPEMSGNGVSDAYPVMDEYGRFKIILKFTKEGRQHFAEVTRTIAEEGQRSGQLGRLAIVLDGKLYSAPTVREEINSDSAEITGTFTQREATDLANVLNNPLDLPLTIKEQYEVGPTLAQDAISSGIKASAIGAALVAGFMIFYYTTGGVIAVLTLIVNVLCILGVLASLGATLTMPGLAGIVLTIGMATDANILIYERMREELALGKTIKTALVSGFDKALITIVDAHITQLVICGVMIWLGTGPIKGFGVTLAIGVFSTLFSVLIFGHVIMELLIEGELMKKFSMRHFLSDVRMDFVKWGKPAFIASWIVVLVGVATVLAREKSIFSIDFTGGDQISLNFKQRIDVAQIRRVADGLKLGEISPIYQQDVGSKVTVLKIETPYGKSGELLAALQKDYPQAGLEKLGENVIGPSIGKEVEWNALLSVGVSLIVVLLYIAFRFEVGFGVGGVVSTVHDILMTIGVFVMLGHQFSAPMVAAILAIAGYSINDTIVVFDRIREELKINPNANLHDIVNLAVHKVFSRSMMTSFSAFLAAFALFVFGGGVIHDLSLTFLIGIITGTFSSIFIASPVFYWWHKGDRKHVESHHDVAPKYEWTGSSRASKAAK